MPRKLTCPDRKAYLAIVSFSQAAVEDWSNDTLPTHRNVEIQPKPIVVAFGSKRADCRCLGEIEATNTEYGITLRLPLQNWAIANEDHWARVKPFIAGVIMHEYVHCLQRQKEGLQNEIKKSEQDGKLSAKTKTPQDYLAYYTGIIEKDAHAAGIAVEVMQSGGSNILISSKDTKKTETWKRIKDRLTNKTGNQIIISDVDRLSSELACLADQYAVPWREDP